MSKKHKAYMRIRGFLLAPAVCSTLSCRRWDEGWRVRGTAARVEMRQREREPKC